MDDDNVVELDTITKLDIPAERILRKAQEAGLESAVVIGWDKDGEMWFASSIAAGPETLWLMELARHQLIEIGINED